MTQQTQLLIIIAATFFVPPGLWGQQEPTSVEEPAPTATGSDEQAEVEGSSPPLTPDPRPLSGAEELRVESPARSRNFVLPSLRTTLFGDSNRTILSRGTAGVEVSGSIVGGLTVQQVSRRSEFALDYQGGGMLYARNSELNAMMHQFGFTETYQGRRWGLMIGDRLSLLPESPFGFAGFGGSFGVGGRFGSNLGSWNPVFNSNQSLFTGRGSRIANSALTQIQYNASSRSSFTISGSYGLLRFREPGYIESDFGQATVGYNYAINRRDNIALTYGVSLFRYQGIDYEMNAHYAQIAYSHRVTGRVAFQMAGGPQLVIAHSGVSGKQSRASWTAHTALHYRRPRTSFEFSYAHYTSNGSGLLLGASTDQFRTSVGVRLTRNWHWSLSPGYSRNEQLRQGPTVGTASAYNSVYASTGLSRTLGRYADLSLHYVLQEQWSDARNPTGINTGSSFLRHNLGISLAWHGRKYEM